jgi:hypothetical protein
VERSSEKQNCSVNVVIKLKKKIVVDCSRRGWLDNNGWIPQHENSDTQVGTVPCIGRINSYGITG